MKVKKRIIKCLVLSFVLLSIFVSLIIPSFASSDDPPMFAIRPVGDGYSVPGSVPVILTYNLALPSDNELEPFYDSPYALIVDPLFNSLEVSYYYDKTFITQGINDITVTTTYDFLEMDPGMNQYIPSNGSANGCGFHTDFENFYGECDSIDMEARGFYVDTNGVYSDSDYFSQVQFTFDDQLYYYNTLDIYVSYVKAGDLNDGLNRMVYETTLSDGEFSSFQLVPDAFIESLDDGLYYVEYIKTSLNNPNITNLQLYGASYTYVSVYNDFRDRDILSYTPPETPMDPGIFADYTSWIGTAVGGFIDLEIVQGFTLGGILMTIIGFMIAIWFLKLLAGG